MYFGYNNKEDLKDAVLAAAQKNLLNIRVCMDVFRNAEWSTYSSVNDLVCRVIDDSVYWGGDF